MKEVLFLFLILLHTNLINAQLPLSETCGPNIPSLCDGETVAGTYTGFPASTSQNLFPTGPDYGCLNGWGLANPAFFYFEASTNGNLTILIEPVDASGAPLVGFAQPDLDFICWGPFSSTTTMCGLLTTTNIEDCGWAGTAGMGLGFETCEIFPAVAGGIYVILVANWNGTSNTTAPDPCFIEFTASTPLSCCEFAGDDNAIDVCDTDSPFDLITALNNSPSSGGVWEDATGNVVSNMFDPSTDPGGIYSYIIAGTSSCVADTGFVDINLTITPSLSITSPLTACSGISPITLTGNPAGGFFSGTNVTGNSFDPSIIGNNNITYTYQASGCTSIINENMLVFESPTVLTQNIITTNPNCPGESTGTAIISLVTGGTGPYLYNYNGEDFQALPAGTFNYTITDVNLCTFDGSVIIYDPSVNTPSLTAYNSSCYGENDGSIGITMNSPTTPPGTVSTLAYCSSSPSTNAFFVSTPSAIIENVTLNGDNNDINNNTAGVADLYEDYTASMYADITEGWSYTVDVTLNGLGAPGTNQNYSGGKVYIDYNINGDFTDPGEEVGIIPYRDATTIGLAESITFTVPSTGAYGPTRMRVVSQYIGGIASPNSSSIGPCDDPGAGFAEPWHGATEDYSIVLNAPSLISSILWDNAATVDSITNLSPGTYSVTITSNLGCIIEDSAEVLEPAQLFFNADITNLLCNNDATGQISLSPSGGNGGGYNYSWDTSPPTGVFGGNNASVSGLAAGLYTVTITDPSTIIIPTNPVACAADTTIEIRQPAYFNVDFTTSSNSISPATEICLDDPVTLDFDFNQGGIAPFTINYTINGSSPQSYGPINNSGPTSITITPTVGSTTYTITSISDSGGCINQNVISSQSIDVNPLPDINLTVAPNPICVGDDATLLFSAPGGTPPYVVEYFDGAIAKIENVPAAGSSLLVNPTNTTTYRLSFVTDDKGCESNLTDSITLVVNEIPEVILTTPTETCKNEIIQLQFDFTAGSAPWAITYDLDGNSSTVPMYNSFGSIEISLSSSTIFTLNSVTDDNLCKNDIDETVTIITHSLPEIKLSGGGSLCADGSTTDITFTSTSGTPPYNLTYSAGVNSNFVSDIGNIYTISTNQSGVYTIQNLIDSKGCKATAISGSAYISVNPLPEANITAYPTATTITNPVINFIDMSNGHTNGYWDFADGEIEISNLGKIYHTYSDTGIYQVSLNIESDSGCTDIAWQTIIISPVFSVYIPNAFTPNNDLNNDLFLPIVDGVKEYEFSIYDRQGKRIFTTNKTNLGWDGKVSDGGKYVPKGVYIYALVLTDINGKSRTYEGAVTLIR